MDLIVRALHGENFSTHTRYPEGAAPLRSQSRRKSRPSLPSWSNGFANEKEIRSARPPIVAAREYNDVQCGRCIGWTIGACS